MIAPAQVARRGVTVALTAVRGRADWALRQLDATTGAGTADGGDGAPGEGGARRYAELWSPSTLDEAMAQIYNTTDPASFEEGGRIDHRWLARNLRPEHTALDLGCGIGRVAYYVAGECNKLWAIDVSPQMLELAGERLRQYDNVAYGRCEDVLFPDVPSESVDLAYSLLVLQHVEREDAFLLLEELHRVVRPGGLVMLTLPNLLAPVYLQCFLDYAHARASSQAGRARLYTAPEAECLVRAAGFDSPQLEVDTEIRITARRP